MFDGDALRKESENIRAMFENPLFTEPIKVTSAAEMQFETIKRYIQQFQQVLDSKHDVGLLLTDFGQSVLMAVTEIGCEPPHLMVFRGLVNGVESTLIQNVSRLNFLITAVPKDPKAEHRQIGFSVASGERLPTNQRP